MNTANTTANCTIFFENRLLLLMLECMLKSILQEDLVGQTHHNHMGIYVKKIHVCL